MIRSLLIALCLFAGQAHAVQVMPFQPRGGGAGFTPDDLSCEIWLDSNDTTAVHTDTALTTDVTTSGDDAQGWEDKGSLGDDFTEGTAPPDWVDPGVQFVSGSSEFLTTGTTSTWDEMHLFMVFERAATANFGRMFSASETAGSDSFDEGGIAISEESSGGGIEINHNLFDDREMSLVATSTISLNTIYLMEVHFDFIDGTSELLLDGSSEATDTSGNDPHLAWDPDVFTLSAESPDNDARFSSQTVYSLIMCDVEITGSDLTDLRTYLDDTYTIPGL